MFVLLLLSFIPDDVVFHGNEQSEHHHVHFSIRQALVSISNHDCRNLLVQIPVLTLVLHGDFSDKVTYELQKFQT